MKDESNAFRPGRSARGDVRAVRNAGERAGPELSHIVGSYLHIFCSASNNFG